MANKKVFFKIVVPNYNNFIYIKKCLDSIKNQTFKDYICIVIDDLSTDRSFEIAQIYAKNDPEHFVAIKLDKKGYAGAARNKGAVYPVDCEYIYFLDSDDYLTSSISLQTAYQTIINAQITPDIVRCSFTNLWSSHKDIFKASLNFREIVFGGAQPWKNIVHKKFIDIRFKEMRAKNNDVLWFLRLMDKINQKRISVLNSTDTFVTHLMDSKNSCQLSHEIANSRRCIDSVKLLAFDLKDEIYNDDICKQYKQKMITMSNHTKSPFGEPDITKW